MTQVDITNAQLTTLLEIDGQMHLIAFAKDDWEVVQLIVKKNVLGLKKTARTQRELNEFFDYKEETGK